MSVLEDWAPMGCRLDWREVPHPQPTIMKEAMIQLADLQQRLCTGGIVTRRRDHQQDKEGQPQDGAGKMPRRLHKLEDVVATLG